MRRRWHVSFVTVALGLAAIVLAGCPKRPALAPEAGPAPAAVPSVGAPAAPTPGPVTAAPTPAAPGVPSGVAPAPGPVTAAPAAPGAPTAPGARATPGGPAVPGPVTPAPATPGGPAMPGPVTPGAATPGVPGAPAPAAPGVAETPGTGTVIPALPSPREFVETAALGNIYFDFDKYNIRPGDAEILEENARWLKANADVLFLIEGHCDERGTNEYNLALGERRAKATRDYLESLGVAASRISTISYGEERPVCIERTESCWAQNRRAHFLVKLAR